MSHKPVISVLSLCYNNSENVIKTLSVIKNQTYKEVDHIILDDGSKDGSGEKVKAWIKDNNYICRFIQNSENIGICKSLNKMLKIVKGEYLAFNSDDYWEPFQLEKSLEILNRSGADVIYTSTEYCNAKGEFLQYLEDTLQTNGYPRFKNLFPSGDSHFILSKDDAVDALFYSNYLHLLSLIIPTKTLLSLGGFNENLPFEDYDLNFNICGKLKVCFNRGFTVKYYKHEKSYTEVAANQVYLHWGIILTLVNHLPLLKMADTRKRVENSIKASCLFVLYRQPIYFFKVIRAYNKVLPGRRLKNLYSFFRVLLSNYKKKLSAVEG